MASIFADEIKKNEDDPAEKYWKQTKEQKLRIDILESSVQELTHSNGELKNKLERAKYVADHLATEVMDQANPDYEQLEADYKEVEAEVDELTEINKNYEEKMAETAKILDNLELEIATMKPKFADYPNLVKNIEEQRNQIADLGSQIKKISDERDDFEDKYLQIKQKDVIPLDQHKSTVKSMKEQMKEIQSGQSKLENEKEDAIKEMEKHRKEVGDIKMKLGTLQKDNEKLLKGGG
eukprot:68767_1